MVPWDWDKMCLDDHYMQLGGLVFIGSECSDFGHKRMHNGSDTPSLIRARAYEAEYLLTLQKQLPNFKPNNYQRQILAQFPKGLDSHLVTPFRYNFDTIYNEDFVKLGQGG
jgi:hypothetical protein